MPPNTPEIEVPVHNESSMIDYCRFAQAVLSMAHTEGFDADFDLGFEQVDCDPPDRPRVRFVLYTDNVLWHRVMKTKDLQPELLRWYLRLKMFNFVIRDKANVHTLTNPDQE